MPTSWEWAEEAEVVVEDEVDSTEEVGVGAEVVLPLVTGEVVPL